MDFRQLSYFVAVAQFENFSKASRLLHVTQPALSRQIQALENDIGVPLFERLPRGVRLTPAGVTLAEHARKIFHELEMARVQVRRTHEGLIGQLRLGLNPVAVRNALIPEVVRRFRNDRPGVHLGMSAIDSFEQLGRLRDGSLDVGFLYATPSEHDDLEFVEIAPYQLSIVMLRSHRLARRKTLRLADLRDEVFVWSSRQRFPLIHDQLIAECMSKGISLRIALEADSTDAMINLVAVGMGIAFVHPALHTPTRELVHKPVRDLSLVWPLYMVWRSDIVSPPVAGLVKLMRQALEAPAVRRTRTGQPA